MLTKLFAPLYMKICAGIISVLLVGFATQTIRIEGFKMWPLHVVGFKEENYTLRLDLDKIKDAQIRAKEKAEAEKLRIENIYREKAEKADAEYKANLASAYARADAYARRMRVQVPRSASSGASTAAENNATEGPDGSGEDAFVAVSRTDFDILNENTIRLQQAHEWALSLNEPSGD